MACRPAETQLRCSFSNWLQIDVAHPQGVYNTSHRFIPNREGEHLSLQLQSLEDLISLPTALDPRSAEEAIQATLHLAGWRRDLTKIEIGRALSSILAAVHPGPGKLSVEIRRALLGWAAGSTDPNDLPFMEHWREVILKLDLNQAALQLVESSRARCDDPAYHHLLDRTQRELEA